MPYSIQKAVVHIKTHGFKSFCGEAFRRFKSFFYVRTILILHEKDLSEGIPDLIGQYKLKLICRFAQSEDIVQLKKIVRLSEEALIDNRLKNGKKVVIGFNPNGEAVGYFWTSDKNEYVEEIDTVIDDPYVFDGVTLRQYRGKGTMVALLQRGLEHFRDNGAQKVVALTLPDNKPILGVLSRFGFRPKKKIGYRRMLFFKAMNEEDVV